MLYCHQNVHNNFVLAPTVLTHTLASKFAVPTYPSTSPNVNLAQHRSVRMADHGLRPKQTSPKPKCHVGCTTTVSDSKPYRSCPTLGRTTLQVALGSGLALLLSLLWPLLKHRDGLDVADGDRAAREMSRNVFQEGGAQWMMMALGGQEKGIRWGGYFLLDDIGYTTLAKAAIPDQIPRADLMTSMRNWAQWQFEETGYQEYGQKMAVSSPATEDGQCLNFTITFATVDPKCPLFMVEVGLDTEEVLVQGKSPGSDYYDRGRHFIVRTPKGPVPADAKPAIHDILAGLSQAMVRAYEYYANWWG